MTARTPALKPRSVCARRLNSSGISACRRIARSMAPEQRTTAARAFQANRELLLASKLILDTKNLAYRAVTAVRSEASSYWRTVTLPFPEAGVRLLPQNSLGMFASTIRLTTSNSRMWIDRSASRCLNIVRPHVGTAIFRRYERFHAAAAADMLSGENSRRRLTSRRIRTNRSNRHGILGSRSLMLAAALPGVHGEGAQQHHNQC
jgi:hypothetical protein